MEVTVIGHSVEGATQPAARESRSGRDIVMLPLQNMMGKIVLHWEVQRKLGIVQIYRLVLVSRIFLTHLLIDTSPFTSLIFLLRFFTL